LKVLSVCQSWFALLRAQPVIRRHDLAVLVDGAEDHEVGARAQRADLGDSSGPNRREKASCASSVTSWPRKTMTECCSSAARASL
jgi:hypothetical protein